MRCNGIGFDLEPAHIASEEPLRGDGLARAIKAALADARSALHEQHYRITDLSGEQYYFKEASLAISRQLRIRVVNFELWHPAEAIGETGACIGLCALTVANSAFLKGYAPGQNVLLHFSTDSGARAALVCTGRSA